MAAAVFKPRRLLDGWKSTTTANWHGFRVDGAVITQKTSALRENEGAWGLSRSRPVHCHCYIRDVLVTTMSPCLFLPSPLSSRTPAGCLSITPSTSQPSLCHPLLLHSLHSLFLSLIVELIPWVNVSNIGAVTSVWPSASSDENDISGWCFYNPGTHTRWRKVNT